MLPVWVKQYSFIQSVLLVGTIIETWRPIFKEKRLWSQQKLLSWLVKNSFFHWSDIPGCENSFSGKWKRFFNEFFLSASGNQFSVKWKEYFLFRALQKLLKFGGGNSCLSKLIFWLVEFIFFPFLRYSFQWKLLFVQWKRIFKQIFQPVWQRRIFCAVKTVFSYLIFFSTSGNRH